uniref:Chromatin structure-remodeling complex protein BSH isoform X2 n=1 Tax=Nicotiana tabacum TaxID=4097 RepID=A0A1S3XKH1_TOBAC|nr:PREDICTED: chromatin structure-remodeling complex protein BSH-like isoform X2 [Nicotiana tabacum]
MKPQSAWGSLKNPVKFKIPTAENLVPIRLDIEIDGQRFRDAFSWNPNDPDSEVVVFAKRTVKDLKLPPGFITQIAQSIQLDLRVNHTVIKDHFFWDLNNFESDPEEFARTFCKDMEIEDPEVGVSSIFFLLSFGCYKIIFPHFSLDILVSLMVIIM